MAQTAHDVRPMTHAGTAFAGRGGQVLAFAAVLFGAALFVPDYYGAAALGAMAASLATLTLAMRLRNAHRDAPVRMAARLAGAFSDNDETPTFFTGADGQVLFRNPAATQRFGTGIGEQTLARALGELFADPASVIHRLLSVAERKGGAQEDVVTRRGHVRISVHSLGVEGFFWRFDEMEDRSGPRGAAGGSLPMMTAGRTGAILFMNDAARNLLGGRAKTLEGIFGNSWTGGPGPVVIQSSEGLRSTRVLEIENTAGRREIYLLPVTEEENGNTAAQLEFEALPVPVLQLDRGGAIQRSNRLARDLLGISGDSANLADQVEGLGRPVRDWLQDVAEGRAANRSEVLRASRPDREVFLQIALERVEASEGTVLVAVLHDATELKTLEAQFVQSQKMQAIGQLAGGVAHDFNNLLTAITGHCDLLLLRHEQDDLDYGDLMQINQNANRAAYLVGQLLAFSRKQTLRPEFFDLRDTLTDLTHLLNRLVGERISLVFSHDSEPLVVRADRRQMEQVIMNLVVNARDAMPEGGEIRIETVLHELRDNLHRDRAVVPAGDYVVVRVIDEGTGMGPDLMNKVFEPFFTTKRTGEGTGLGLSMAYGIVKQSGGYIFIDSSVGSGTCFTLYFPAREEEVSLEPSEETQRPDSEASLSPRTEEPAMPAAPPPAKGPGGEGVVLLVEDEAPVRAFAARALRLRGHTVLEADCAEAALDILTDEGLEVDVFVTDVVMPGLDGPTWVRRALETHPTARVVFVSGYAEETFAEIQGELPQSVFLPKPFSLTQLTTTVQQQLIN